MFYLFLFCTLYLNVVHAYYYMIEVFPLFLRPPEIKVLDPNGPYIRTIQTKIKKLLFVGNFRKIAQKWTVFIFGNTYHDQIFKECVSN